MGGGECALWSTIVASGKGSESGGGGEEKEEVEGRLMDAPPLGADHNRSIK